MSKNNSYNWKSFKVMKRAVNTFARLTEALRIKVDALGGKVGAPEVDPTLLIKDIIAHQGAWKMAADALKKYEEDKIDKGGVGKDGIDFAKAREEVLSRIARFVARGRGRQVS